MSERGGASPPTTAHYLSFRVVRLEFIGSPKPLLAGTVDRTEMLEGIERGAESKSPVPVGPTAASILTQQRSALTGIALPHT